MRMQVPSLALLSKLRIWPFCELWCRSKMWLRFHIAVAVVQASSYSSDSTPSLGISVCRRCGPKKQSKKKGNCPSQFPTWLPWEPTIDVISWHLSKMAY